MNSSRAYPVAKASRFLSSPGFGSHLPRFRPERRTVIDSVAFLLLPLVHHLVQEGVHDVVPGLRPNEPTGYGNFGHAMGRGGGVVAESRAHAAGYDHVDVAQRTAETFLVQPAMLRAQSLDQLEIVGMTAPHGTCAVCRWNRKADEDLFGKAPLNAATVDEQHNRVKHLGRRIDKRFVYAEMFASKRHVDRTISCEGKRIDAAQPSVAKAREHGRGFIEWEFELRVRTSPRLAAAPPAGQVRKNRSKHCAGSGLSRRSPSSQKCGVTVSCDGVISIE